MVLCAEKWVFVRVRTIDDVTKSHTTWLALRAKWQDKNTKDSPILFMYQEPLSQVPLSGVGRGEQVLAQGFLESKYFGGSVFGL